MSTPRLCAAAALLAFAPACAPMHTAASRLRADDGDVVLRSGDQVRILVWRSEELSGEFTVGPDGALVHPLYRTIPVAGIPLRTVETRVRDYLRTFHTEPQFVVEPLVRVVVGGEVARANVYMLRPDVTIVQAVALAGGATERGRRDRILVLRSDGAFPLLVRDPQAARLRIRSGDQLVIERRRAVFREVVAPVIGVTGAIAAIVTAVYNAREARE